MSVIFKKHIEKFITIDDATYQEVIAFFEIISVKKKENLMEEGEFCNYHFFVEQGCIRKFFLKNTGVEQTTEFALEHWWMTDTFAFERQEQSTFYIQAIERSVVLRISHDNREAYCKVFLLWNTILEWYTNGLMRQQNEEFVFYMSFREKNYTCILPIITRNLFSGFRNIC